MSQEPVPVLIVCADRRGVAVAAPLHADVRIVEADAESVVLPAGRGFEELALRLCLGGHVVFEPEDDEPR